MVAPDKRVLAWDKQSRPSVMMDESSGFESGPLWSSKIKWKHTRSSLFLSLTKQPKGKGL